LSKKIHEDESTKSETRLFGFLPNKWTIEFDGGKISPIPEFDNAAAWVDKYTNEDGFLYPATMQRVEVDPITMKPSKYIPKTERPAHLHRIRPSHKICLSTSGLPEDIRKGPGSFIIHLLAYLFGVRLQFENWWVDGRLPIREKARTQSISFAKDTAEDFLSHSYQTWKHWSQKEQKLITNILFMHSRAPSYEWDWERFTIEYMVLDGCLRLVQSLHLIQRKQRKKKKPRDPSEPIKTLCDSFSIPCDGDLACKIVSLRNQLFHRTLWDGSQPGTAVSSLAFMSPIHLRRLNQRLIPALFEYKTPYIKTAWWFSGIYSLDQPSEK
jgi:hypothetical protein